MRIPAHRLAVAPLLVALAAVLPAVAATPKACDLFPARAAASLVGGPLNAPIDAGGIMCGYNSQTANLGATFTITGPAPQGANLKRSVGASINKGDTLDVIPGLGDQNVFVTRQNNESDLTVIAGGKMLILRVDKPASPALKSAMVEVMKQIVGKL